MVSLLQTDLSCAAQQGSNRMMHAWHSYCTCASRMQLSPAHVNPVEIADHNGDGPFAEQLYEREPNLA
jgi:hypothetical protein